MPLHRHPAIAPFSRDHHHVLLLARGIQKGASDHIRATLPSDLRALAEHVCRVYDDTLAPHFADEEEGLIRAARGRDAALDALCSDIEAEHAKLGAMIAELRAPSLPIEQIEPLLDRLGKRLEALVRTEERALFEGVQQKLGEDALDALAPRR